MADELDDQLDYSFHDSSPEAESLPAKDLEPLEDESPKEATPEPPRKKRKVKDKSKKGLSEKRQLRMLQQVDKKKSLGQMDPATVADFILSSIKDHKGNEDLSILEVEERSVPQSQLVDVQKFEKERTLENIGDFVKEFGLSNTKGKELLLVLSMSAVRVCEVARACKGLSKFGALKLINKNKLKYDKKGLQSKANLAVATPGRVRKLVADDVLDLSRVKCVLVDSSFLDVKTNSVWDLEETIPLLAGLAREGAKIYLY